MSDRRGDLVFIGLCLMFVTVVFLMILFGWHNSIGEIPQ
jgi:hypothetical protein